MGVGRCAHACGDGPPSFSNNLLIFFCAHLVSPRPFVSVGGINHTLSRCRLSALALAASRGLNGGVRGSRLRAVEIQYVTVLHCTILHCTVNIQCSALYCKTFTILLPHCTVLYCTALYCTILCCTELHCVIGTYHISSRRLHRRRSALTLDHPRYERGTWSASLPLSQTPHSLPRLGPHRSCCNEHQLRRSGSP